MHPKRERNLNFALERTFVDFLENTSIHGLKYTIVKKSSVWERAFWGLVICVMVIGAVYLSFLHLRRFIENPMRSTIISFHGPVYLVPFPAVTICNANLMLHSKITPFLKSLNLEDEEKKFLKENIPQFIGFFQSTDYSKTKLSKMQTIFEKIGYADVVTVLKRIGPTCEDMLVQCRWNGEPAECSEIFEDSLTIDGLCCSFNYYGSRFDFKPYYTIFTGESSGLSVTINSLPQKVQYSTEKATGVKVTIHDPLEYPGFERTYKPVSIGSSALFQVSAQKLTNTEEVLYLSKKQRKCVFSGERPLKYHKHYHFSNCLVENYSRLIFRFCGCVPFYFTFSVRPKCDISQMECLQRYIKERRASDQTDTYCPARCENVVYRVFSSKVLINNVTVALSEENKNKIPDDSAIRIKVFFTGTQTLLSRDVITSSLDLLSSIGGIYGLFMGCSIITIVEVIYHCTLRFLVNLGWLGRKGRGRKKRTNNPESEFRTGWTHRRHDVHAGIEWNNITFARIEMKLRAILLVATAVLYLSQEVEGSKILGVFWTPSKSHHILGSALMQALAKKGHNVTLLSPFHDDVDIPTFKQIKLSGIEGSLASVTNPTSTFLEKLGGFLSSLETNTEKFWENEPIKDLIKSREEYDVIISLNFFNDGILALNHHLGAPTIIFHPAASSAATNNYVGNPNLPYNGNPFMMSSDTENSFFGRLWTTTSVFLMALMQRYVMAPPQERITRSYLPNSPPVSELKKEISLLMVNAHTSLEPARPYVPNMVQIGGFYAQTNKKLPENLQTYLDSAKEGAVLFSFGTNMKIAEVDKDKLDAILKGLGKIAPMKVLFKSEVDLKDVPKNVLVSKWLPQNDVLAHPNIKAFITHGGLGGNTEAVYHGVPMIGIPLFADQKTNIQNAIKAGYAIRIFYEDINQETVDKALEDILKNPSYAKSAKMRSSLLRKQPMNPMDKAIWWVEHIIEHKGGEHLRNLGMDLEWYQFYMVDVMLFYVAVIVIMSTTSILTLRWIVKKLFFKSTKKTKKE